MWLQILPGAIFVLKLQRKGVCSSFLQPSMFTLHLACSSVFPGSSNLSVCLTPDARDERGDFRLRGGRCAIGLLPQQCKRRLGLLPVAAAEGAERKQARTPILSFRQLDSHASLAQELVQQALPLTPGRHCDCQLVSGMKNDWRQHVLVLGAHLSSAAELSASCRGARYRGVSTRAHLGNG